MFIIIILQWKFLSTNLSVLSLFFCLFSFAFIARNEFNESKSVDIFKGWVEVCGHY